MNFIKKWLGKIAHEAWRSGQETEQVRTNKLHDMFQSNMAALVAFKIDNGYVVRTMDPHEIYHGARMPGFVYCADHQAIADHIVSAAMRDKLGVQSKIPVEEKATPNAYATSIGRHNLVSN